MYLFWNLIFLDLSWNENFNSHNYVMARKYTTPQNVHQNWRTQFVHSSWKWCVRWNPPPKLALLNKGPRAFILEISPQGGLYLTLSSARNIFWKLCKQVETKWDALLLRLGKKLKISKLLDLTNKIFSACETSKETFQDYSENFQRGAFLH